MRNWNEVRVTTKTAVKIALVAVVALFIAGQFSREASANRVSGISGTILPAHIRPYRSLSVARSFPGTTKSVLVSPGDTVQAGQVLATLESPEIAVALERAEQRWARAQKDWVAWTRGDHSRPGSRIYAEQYRSALRSAELARARVGPGSLPGLQSTSERLAAQAAQVQKLAEQELANEEEVERSQQQADQARQAVQAALEHQSRVDQEADVADSQLRVSKLQLELHDSTEEASLRREYEEAAWELQAARRHAGELTVTAPFTGTVLTSPALTGESFVNGRTLFEIADLSRLRIEVPVAAGIARQVNKGSKVMIRLPLDPPREVASTVSEILLAPESGANAYTIRTSVPNPDPRAILTGLEAAVVFPFVRKDGFPWARLPF